MLGASGNSEPSLWYAGVDRSLTSHPPQEIRIASAALSRWESPKPRQPLRDCQNVGQSEDILDVAERLSGKVLKLIGADVAPDLARIEAQRASLIGGNPLQGLIRAV